MTNRDINLLSEAYNQIVETVVTAEDAAQQIVDSLHSINSDDLESVVFKISKNNDAVNHDDAQAVAAHEIRNALQDIRSDNPRVKKVIDALEDMIKMRSGHKKTEEKDDDDLYNRFGPFGPAMRAASFPAPRSLSPGSVAGAARGAGLM
jgi:hypothetical protein